MGYIDSKQGDFNSSGKSNFLNYIFQHHLEKNKNAFPSNVCYYKLNRETDILFPHNCLNAVMFKECVTAAHILSLLSLLYTCTLLTAIIFLKI